MLVELQMLHILNTYTKLCIVQNKSQNYSELLKIKKKSINTHIYTVTNIPEIHKRNELDKKNML